MAKAYPEIGELIDGLQKSYERLRHSHSSFQKMEVSLMLDKILRLYEHLQELQPGQGKVASESVKPVFSVPPTEQVAKEDSAPEKPSEEIPVTPFAVSFAPPVPVQPEPIFQPVKEEAPIEPEKAPPAPLPDPIPVQQEEVLPEPVIATPQPTSEPKSELKSPPAHELSLHERLKGKDEVSLHERLATGRQKPDLAEKLKHARIQDIRTAISLNQKIIFIRELFRGDGGEYRQALEEINGCASLQQAEDEVLSLLEGKFNWVPGSAVISEFRELVQRRFL